MFTPGAADSSPPQPPESAVGISSGWPVRTNVPWATISFIVACLLMYFRVQAAGGSESTEALQASGWRDAYTIWDGQWWAIPTGTLLHQNLFHLSLCLAGIIPFGWGVERYLGFLRTFALFAFLAGMTSAVAFAYSGNPGIGSSALAYALFGFVLLCQFRFAVLPLWILIPLQICGFLCALVDVGNVVSDLAGLRSAQSQIGSDAHLIGLFLGLLTSAVFVHHWRVWLTGTILAALGAFAVVGLFWAPWQMNWCAYQAYRAYQTHDFQQLEFWTDRAVSLRPNYAEGRRARGGLRWQLGNIDGAIEDYSAAIRLSPAESRLHIERSHLYELRGEWKLARDDVESAIETASRNQTPEDVWMARSIRAIRRMNSGDLDDAERDLDAMRQFTADPYVLVTLAALYGETARFAQAKAILDELLSPASPPNPSVLTSAYIARGWIHLIESRFDHHAKPDLEQAVQILEQSLIEAPGEPVARAHLGIAHIGLKQYAVAIQHADAALQMAPRFGDAHAIRGMALLLLHRPEEALVECDTALESRPGMHGTRTVRGQALLALHKPAEALADFDRALAVNPRYVNAHIGRSEALRELGRLDEAAPAIEKALELNPRSAPGWLARGRLALRTGDRSRADESRKRAIELDPELSTEP